MKKIVIINGSGSWGKDTFVKYVAKYLSVSNISSVDVIKEAATLLGWTGDKTEKARLFLSSLKAISTLYNDHSYNYVVSKINEFYNSENDIMFIHIREPEEINKILKSFEAITLLVKRESIEKITTNNSDKNVEDYDYDYVIYNNDISELDQKAHDFIKELGF